MIVFSHSDKYYFIFLAYLTTQTGNREIFGSFKNKNHQKELSLPNSKLVYLQLASCFRTLNGSEGTHVASKIVTPGHYR